MAQPSIAPYAWDHSLRAACQRAQRSAQLGRHARSSRQSMALLQTVQGTDSLTPAHMPCAAAHRARPEQPARLPHTRLGRQARAKAARLALQVAHAQARQLAGRHAPALLLRRVRARRRGAAWLLRCSHVERAGQRVGGQRHLRTCATCWRRPGTARIQDRARSRHCMTCVVNGPPFTHPQWLFISYGRATCAHALTMSKETGTARTAGQGTGPLLHDLCCPRACHSPIQTGSSYPMAGPGYQVRAWNWPSWLSASTAQRRLSTQGGSRPFSCMRCRPYRHPAFPATFTGGSSCNMPIDCRCMCEGRW